MLAIRETTLVSKLKRVFHADAGFHSISFHLLFLLSEIYYAGGTRLCGTFMVSISTS